MNWKARWIWMEGEEKPRNFFLMCRKGFKLDGEIASASLAITADSRYVLYVNGERIGQGPPRSFPWRQNFDSYDIKPYIPWRERRGGAGQPLRTLHIPVHPRARRFALPGLLPCYR